MLRTARVWGIGMALAGLLVDQAHKFWMLGPFGIEEKGRVALTPFLDLIMVWNRGVSYGLLTQEGDLGRWVLIAFGLAGATVFGWWLWHSRRLLTSVALGLVIGGALSNVIDRLLYGAVRVQPRRCMDRGRGRGAGDRLGDGTPRNSHGTVKRRPTVGHAHIDDFAHGFAQLWRGFE
jgi:signal peptidase II